MAITNGYTTLALLKARLGIATADTADDTTLEAIVAGVSRAIDDYCHRRFYTVTETRYFTAEHSRQLLVDDLLSVTSLQTDVSADRTYGTTWAATDYDLAPYNAQLESVPQPYWAIEVPFNGTNFFPVGVTKGVKVAGSWGFSSTTPAAISEACLFQAALAFQGSKGVGASLGVGGTEVRLSGGGLHPWAKQLLDDGGYVRHGVG